MNGTHIGWKMGVHFPVGESQGSLIVLERPGILANFYFSLILIELYIIKFLFLLNLLNKTLKK